MMLSIDSIHTDGGTQPRGAVNPDVIDTYQDAMEDGAIFPPVDVFYDGTDYWLADGFHRIRAREATGADDIECTVHQGTVEDAQWFSFGANKANGLYRSNDDKQRAVKAALIHPKSTTLSDNAIAKHCGVSQPFVSKLRVDTSYNSSKMDIRTVTRGGTTYQQNTANIGKVPKQVDVQDDLGRVIAPNQRELLSTINGAPIKPTRRQIRHCSSEKDFKKTLIQMLTRYRAYNKTPADIHIIYRDGVVTDVAIVAATEDVVEYYRQERIAASRAGRV